MTRRKKYDTKNFGLDEPLCHPDHPKPMTRRSMIAQGFGMGAATVMGGGVMSLFSSPSKVYADLSTDISDLVRDCGIDTLGAGKIPFICFDLAGGANMAGSNVLVGQRGGQLDSLSVPGYSKLGLPADMIPTAPNADVNLTDHINQDLGLAFHSDSAFLRGMQGSMSAAAMANTNGVVIPARSDNDTGNNPHIPLYGIARAGASGSLMEIIGSRATDSGGNSMSPAMMMGFAPRPTKVDRPSDVTSLVDVGDLVGLLDQSEAVKVMESIQRISEQKMSKMGTGVTRDDVIKELVRCGYVKAADLAFRFGDPATLDPAGDPDIVGDAGIFTSEEFMGDREFQKTASVMKLVINGFAGAGCVTMGGYDYHGGARRTGERRDFRAGRCMGACLEYAARLQKPLMMYVSSDGSLSSNGAIDDSEDGRGKGEWTSDNSSTAASFILVYNPNGRPTMLRQQIGYMRPDASVEVAATPIANNVNLLVEAVVLNYMALHGEQGNFSTLFPGHGLGSVALRDSLTAFEPIVSGTI